MISPPRHEQYVYSNDAERLASSLMALHERRLDRERLRQLDAMQRERERRAEEEHAFNMKMLREGETQQAAKAVRELAALVKPTGGESVFLPSASATLEEPPLPAELQPTGGMSPDELAAFGAVGEPTSQRMELPLSPGFKATAPINKPFGETVTETVGGREITSPLEYLPDVEARQRRDKELSGEYLELTRDYFEQIPEVLRPLLGKPGDLVKRTTLSSLLSTLGKQPRTVQSVPGGYLTFDDNEQPVFHRTVAERAMDVSGADVFPGVTGERLLDSLNDQDRANVTALIEGRADPRALASLRNNRREYLLGLAARIDPTFNMADYGTRAKTRQDFATGKAAQNVRSLNTVMKHLDTFRKSADALSNAGFQTWNRIVNWGLTQAGDPRVTNFEKAANAVESELASLFKGMGATDQEIKAWRQTLNAAQSPAQLQQGVQQLVELVGGRMSALSDQYERGMGRQMKPDELLSPSAREIYDRLSSERSTGGSEGVVHISGDAEYDALPSGTFFVGPDGVKRQKP